MNLNNYLNKNVRLIDPEKMALQANGGAALPEYFLKEAENMKVVRVFNGGAQAYVSSDTLSAYIVCVPECRKDSVYNEERGCFSYEWQIYVPELACFEIIE